MSPSFLKLAVGSHDLSQAKKEITKNLERKIHPNASS